MKKLTLSRGYVSLVDDDDFSRLSKHIWWVNTSGSYARGYRQVHEKNIYLSREIMNAPKGMFVDHINGNALDNRKKNLRICTQYQNILNRGMSRSNTSGFKGVCWNKQMKKWMASTKKDKKTVFIGLFDSKKEAAHAYDVKALFLFGEFARLNFSRAEYQNAMRNRR